MSFEETNEEVATTKTDPTAETTADVVVGESATEAAVVEETEATDDDSSQEDGTKPEEGAIQKEEGDSKAETPELTDEDLDRIADTAIETLREILAYFGAEDAAIDEYEGEDGELILDVVGANLAVLIGRYGKTLDALQFLLSSIVNKKIGFRYPLIVDIEGYRHRRRQKLESVAKSSAARCIRSKSDVRLRPMTPYERRIIHIILRNERRVVTESEGDEPNRCVVVRPN